MDEDIKSPCDDITPLEAFKETYCDEEILEEINVIRFIDQGASGYVFEVEYNDNVYALKLMFGVDGFHKELKNGCYVTKTISKYTPVFSKVEHWFLCKTIPDELLSILKYRIGNFRWNKIKEKYNISALTELNQLLAETTDIDTLKDIMPCFSLNTIAHGSFDTQTYQPNLGQLEAVSAIFESFYSLIIAHHQNFSHNDVALNLMYKKVKFGRHYEIYGEKFTICVPTMIIITDYDKSKIRDKPIDEIDEGDYDEDVEDDLTLYEQDLKQLYIVFRKRYLDFPVRKYASAARLIRDIGEILERDIAVYDKEPAILKLFNNHESLVKLRGEEEACPVEVVKFKSYFKA